jgi:hypothetical protein
MAGENCLKIKSFRIKKKREVRYYNPTSPTSTITAL